MWTRSSAEGRKTYDTIAQAFTQKTGIRVEYFNAWTDFEQRIARAAIGGDLPDLIINDSGATGQFVQMGMLEAVDRNAIAGGADLHERAWEAAESYDGKYYGVPTSAQAHVMYVRKDWRLKLKLQAPQTWADVEALAKAFTAGDPDGNGRADTYGLIFPGSAQRGYAAWYLSSFLWQAGGEFVREVGPRQFRGAMDEAAAVTAVSFMRKLHCELKVTQPGAMNAPTQEANKAFLSGQAGIYLSGPYHIPLFDKEPGRDKVEVMPAPAGPAGRGVLGGGELAYFPKAARNKQAARKFVEFLISPEGQMIGMKATAGGLAVVRLPVNRKVDAAAVYNDPRWQMVAQEYANHGHLMPAIPNWTSMQQLIGEGVNAVLSRCSKDVATDLQKLNIRVNRELSAQRVLAK
ncbi:MAG: sugar ABC transporter substrate-binding protein [Rhodoferax sp.]|nr:sugar ABC transporter substrate-binding protein [Rhodoferax sp.]